MDGTHQVTKQMLHQLSLCAGKMSVYLEFNDQVRTIKVMSSQSVYLTTPFLGRLIYVVLLMVNQYLSTFFPRQLTNALLELAKGTEWLLKIFHDQSSQKNITRPGRDRTCDLVISSKCASDRANQA